MVYNERSVEEVVSQTSEPQNPSEGLIWFNPSDLSFKYYDGSSFVSPGNSIDNNSITENSNGALQVSQPLNMIIGDFEAGNSGIWSLLNESSSDTEYTYTSDSSRGNDALETFTGSGLTSAGIERSDIDFTGKEKLLLDTKVVDSSNEGAEVFVEVDGNQIGSISTLTSYQTLELNIEDITGTNHLKIYRDYGSARVLLDNIRMTSDNTRFNGAGN